MSKFFNFAGFQIVWFSCVLGAAYEKYWLAYAATLIFLVVHFSLVKLKQSDIALLVAGVAIGVCVDSMLMNAGLFEFENHGGIFAPIWLLCLWCVFPLTINYSLGWLKGHFLTAAIFGAIGGALSYLAGQKFGAVVIHQQLFTLGIVAIVWAAITPLFLLISSCYDYEQTTA